MANEISKNNIDRDLRSTAMNTNHMWQKNWYFCHPCMFNHDFYEHLIITQYIAVHVRVLCNVNCKFARWLTWGYMSVCMRMCVDCCRKTINFFMSSARLNDKQKEKIQRLCIHHNIHADIRTNSTLKYEVYLLTQILKVMNKGFHKWNSAQSECISIGYVRSQGVNTE